MNQIRPNRKLVRKLYKLCSKALKDKLGINFAKNSKHKDVIKPLIYISINNASAESLRMKIAIDFIEEPYYGKLDMYVTRIKYKSGTDTFHTFATISVVGKDEKERLTLYSLSTLNTKEDIVKEIARKLAKAISFIDGQRFFQNRNDKIA
ncbi:MAG: hypothetical protein RXS42_09145 [Nitrososphaeria archaeon]